MIQFERGGSKEIDISVVYKYKTRLLGFKLSPNYQVNAEVTNQGPKGHQES